MGAVSYPRGRTVPRAKTWYERGDGARFKRDDAIVRTCYPELEWKIDQTTRLAALEGDISIAEPCGTKASVSTRVAFLFDYPKSEPLAFETGHRFVWDKEHHILPATGYCCLWLPPLSRWNPEDPDALRPFLDELVVFFDRQLVLEASGKQRWPGPSWAHGVFGYWDFVIEQLGSEKAADNFIAGRAIGRNEVCPCGSERKYKRCHLPEHEALARRIDGNELKRLRDWRVRQVPSFGLATAS